MALVILLATALGLGLRLYQLARPGYLFGVTDYDDGVDFGSAVRLVSGAVPYRDFALVQPPGITVLMAPVALLAKASGTQTAFAVARILTACAGAASVLLGGLLVRHRGLLATTVACGVLAVFPAGIVAAHTVLLEPWLVFFCLLGALAAFDRDQLATRTSRLFWGGAAFGVAGAIKVWAIFPVLVILALCWRLRGRRAASVYLGGVVAASGLVVLPFVALAPTAFYHSVIVAQLSRVDVSRIAIWSRLTSLTGLDNFHALGKGAVLLVALAIGLLVMLLTLGASLRSRRAPP
ncbi:MAG: DUF2029 domain-containing protein, partial [Solirubrobacterales bacterium]|nr:DUF2029 domain-containing protein [Solirubrobacterales bacterium]